jgi:hypothetical protein
MGERKLDAIASKKVHIIRTLADGRTLGVLDGGNEQNDPLVTAGWVVPGHPVWTRAALKKPYIHEKGKSVSSGSGDAA